MEDKVRRGREGLGKGYRQDLSAVIFQMHPNLYTSPQSLLMKVTSCHKQTCKGVTHCGCQKKAVPGRIKARGFPRITGTSQKGALVL